MNISTDKAPEERISQLLGLISQPVRVQILLIIRDHEACVCHLEAVLGLRQAAISQHLMAMRRAGLVEPRREGRNVFYQLVYPEVIHLIEQSAHFLGVQPDDLQRLAVRPVPDCPCPQCNPGLDADLTCKSSRDERLGA